MVRIWRERSVLYVAGNLTQLQWKKLLKNRLAKEAGPEISYPPATQVRTNEIATPSTAGKCTHHDLRACRHYRSRRLCAFTSYQLLLGGSLGPRITTNLREDKGYTYSPFSTIQTAKGYRCGMNS